MARVERRRFGGARQIGEAGGVDCSCSPLPVPESVTRGGDGIGCVDRTHECCREHVCMRLGGPVQEQHVGVIRAARCRTRCVMYGVHACALYRTRIIRTSTAGRPPRSHCTMGCARAFLDFALIARHAVEMNGAAMRVRTSSHHHWLLRSPLSQQRQQQQQARECRVTPVPSVCLSDSRVAGWDPQVLTGWTDWKALPGFVSMVRRLFV